MQEESVYSWLQEDRKLIVYVADPMCSWCYGFAPELSKALESMPDHDFKLVLGGLRPGGTETMADLGTFLAEHWKEVAKRSGQEFNYDVLDDPDVLIDTEPACRAVVCARSFRPDLSFAFFKDVQRAFYVHNKHMQDAETFIEIAVRHGMDAKEFALRFDSDEIKYQTRADFQLAAEMGISGFPSVIVRHKKQLYLAANGYRSADDLLKVIDKIQAD